MIIGESPLNPVNDKIIELALSSSFADFEDAIQFYAAIENNISILLTRNLKDFNYPLFVKFKNIKLFSNVVFALRFSIIMSPLCIDKFIFAYFASFLHFKYQRTSSYLNDIFVFQSNK